MALGLNDTKRAKFFGYLIMVVLFVILIGAVRKDKKTVKS